MSQKEDKRLSQEKENELPVERHSKVVLFLFIMLLIFGSLYFLWQFLQRPVVGIVGAGKTVSKESSATDTEQLEYQGKYLRFPYPGLYVEKMHELPVKGPVKESIFLSADDVEGKKIAVVVEERKEMVLKASPSFQMRLNKPKEYSKTMIPLDGFDGFIFEKNSQVFEQTAFFFHKGLLVSISVTSPFKIDGLKEGLIDILKSIQWKE